MQRQYVPFKALLGTDVLVIRGLGDAGTATTLPSESDLFRAMLEVGSVNYALYTPTEQIALIERYRALIAALAFPIQILVRVLPLDLEPYLQALARQVSAYHGAYKQATSRATRLVGSRNGVAEIAEMGGVEEVGEVGEVGEGEQDSTIDGTGQATQAEQRAEELERLDHVGQDILLRLAHDHMRHVRSLAVQRGLLERHFYLVIPATDLTSASRAASEGKGDVDERRDTVRDIVFAPLRGLSRAVSPQRRQRTALARAFQRQVVACQQLDLRCAELIRQLSAMRLEARRLREAELVDLAYSCLTPARARHSPITAQRLYAVGLPPFAQVQTPDGTADGLGSGILATPEFR